LEALPVGLLIHTVQGILYANTSAALLLRTKARSLSGRHLLDYIASEDVTLMQSVLQRSFAEMGSTHCLECGIDRSDRSRRLASLTLGRLPWARNPVLQIILQDVTEQKHAEASLRQLTVTDELTGAYNRRHAVYEAELYIGGSANASLPFSLLMIDIDHFKRINDEFGHAAGDAALIALTRLMHNLLPTFRDADSAMFARLGGEEFVVLLPGIGGTRAEGIAERLRMAIGQLQVDTSVGDIRFTVSIGAATFRPHDVGFDGLLKRADAALYLAKQSGRNKVVAA